MGYKPPEDFSAFYEATLNLDKRHRVLSKCYPTPDDLSQFLLQIDTEIFQSNCTKRLDELAVLKGIHTRSKSMIGQGAAKENEAIQFMLGAILHRFLRIYREYTQRKDSKLFQSLGSKPSHSGLYRAISKLLAIDGPQSIDPYTKYRCLSVFYHNMAENNYYKEYKQLTINQQDFLPALWKLLGDLKKLSKPDIASWQAIQFIQSQARWIHGFDEKVRSAYQKLKNQFKVDPELTSLEQLMNKIDTLSLEKVEKKLLKHLLDSNFLRQKFSGQLDADFDSSFFKQLSMHSRYSLFAVYSQVYQENISESFQKALSISMNDEKQESIAPKIKQRALLTYKAWVMPLMDDVEIKASFQAIALDYGYWPDEFSFRAKLEVQLLDLNKKLCQAEANGKEACKLV